jgi:hypothetical protein
MPETRLHIIGDLINNAYGRARKSFAERSLGGLLSELSMTRRPRRFSGRIGAANRQEAFDFDLVDIHTRPTD